MIKGPNISDVDRFLTADEMFQEYAAPLSKHVKLSTNLWGFTLWKKGDVSIRPNHVLKDNMTLLEEYRQDLINGTNRSAKPKKFEIPVNIILINGMKQSIDRDIGVVTTTIDWASLGSSSTAELESHTDLQAEFTDTNYDRKQISTGGSRQRINQTAYYAMLWDDTDFDAFPRSVNEAGLHWHATNSNACHARVVSTTFTFDSGDLFVSQITELQANGSV